MFRVPCLSSSRAPKILTKAYSIISLFLANLIWRDNLFRGIVPDFLYLIFHDKELLPVLDPNRHG
jgi:hypothetical protein